MTFNEGIQLILNDFLGFCKQVDENFDEDYIKSLVTPFLDFLKKRNDDTKNIVDTTPIKTLKPVKTTTANKSVKQVAVKNNNDLSVDDFNIASVEDIKKWSKKMLITPLKNLCTALGLPTTKLTKVQLLDNLIKHKTEQTSDASEGASIANSSEDDAVQPEPPKIEKKRRVISASIPPPKTIKIIADDRELNFVECEEKQDILFVLSDSKDLMGYVSRESYEDKDNMPTIMKATLEVLRLAKNKGISILVSETIED
jgi:hypothetical protein